MKLYIKRLRHFNNGLLVLALFFFAACSKEGTDEMVQPEAPINLLLNETKLNLNVGDTFRLSATGITDKETIQWSSSDTDIATVEDGLVTTLKGGNALITAQVGTAKTTCRVNVAPDVFMVGVKYAIEEGGSTTNYKYWKNEIEYTLEGNGTDIFVEGDDVYIAGSIRINDTRWVACYWKNGERFNLTDGSSSSRANSIFVKNGDVYIAGNIYDGDKGLATLWKNGEATQLLGNFASSAKRVTVDNNDVYVLVTLEMVGFSTASAYFKNDELIQLTSGTLDSDVNDIFLVNGDVHVVGWLYNGSYAVAQYWKNGQPIALVDESEYSRASSVFVEDNQVHIVGVSGGGATDNSNATYWKNGEEIPLQDSSSSYANKIIVVKGIAHIVGGYIPNTTAYGRYWVDGQLTNLPQSIGINSFFIR